MIFSKNKTSHETIEKLTTVGFLQVKHYDDDMDYTYYDAFIQQSENKKRKVEVRVAKNQIQWRYLQIPLEHIVWFNLEHLKEILSKKQSPTDEESTAQNDLKVNSDNSNTDISKPKLESENSEPEVTLPQSEANTTQNETSVSKLEIDTSIQKSAITKLQNTVIEEKTRILKKKETSEEYKNDSPEKKTRSSKRRTTIKKQEVDNSEQEVNILGEKVDIPKQKKRGSKQTVKQNIRTSNSKQKNKEEKVVNNEVILDEDGKEIGEQLNLLHVFEDVVKK